MPEDRRGVGQGLSVDRYKTMPSGRRLEGRRHKAMHMREVKPLERRAVIRAHVGNGEEESAAGCKPASHRPDGVHGRAQVFNHMIGGDEVELAIRKIHGLPRRIDDINSVSVAGIARKHLAGLNAQHRAASVLRNAAGAEVGRLELARPLTTDNFEGVDVLPGKDGGLRFLLASDDNFSTEQRTLLLAFDWKP